MHLIGLWVYCLDCLSVMFEAAIVCLPFSQGNAVCRCFVWVTVCVLEEERTVTGVATQKMIFHA